MFSNLERFTDISEDTFFQSFINPRPAELQFILFAKTVDPDQRLTLFSSLIENTCLQLECCRLTG